MKTQKKKDLDDFFNSNLIASEDVSKEELSYEIKRVENDDHKYRYYLILDETIFEFYKHSRKTMEIKKALDVEKMTKWVKNQFPNSKKELVQIVGIYYRET